MKSPKDKFNLSEYIQIFRRRKWFFVIPLLIIYFSFFVTSFFLPKFYEAKAIILVEEKNVVNPLLKNLAVSTTVAQRLHTLREEILAWPRLYQLVERLELTKNIKSPLELEKLIVGIRSNINLAMKSNDVVVISYQGRDRRVTQRIVNTLCDILIERNISIINENTESAIDFIDEQLGVYKEKLNASESSLREFKEIYGLEVFPQIKQAQDDGDDDSNTNATTGYTAPIVHIGSELAKLEADLVMASVDCTDEHPRVIDLKRRIASLKEKRDSHIQEAAKRTGVNTDSYVEIAGSLPRQHEELTRLNRDKAVNEKIYRMLLQRLESAKITESLDNSENRTKFRVIEPARLPLFASKPNKLKINFLGFILGGMLGFGCIYILEFADSSFKSIDELKESFGAPVLGSIPKILTEEDLDKKGISIKKIIIAIGIITILVTILSIIMARHGAGIVKLMG